MRVTLDKWSDAAKIYFTKIGAGESAWQHVVEDDRAAGMVVLDFDKSGRLLAVEVVGAGKGLPPDVLEIAEHIGP